MFKDQALAILAKHGFTILPDRYTFTLCKNGKPTPIVENSEEAIIDNCMKSNSQVGKELRELNEKDLQKFNWDAKSLLNL